MHALTQQALDILATLPPDLRAALQPPRLALLDADAHDPEILPHIIAQVKLPPPFERHYPALRAFRGSLVG